jgi:hypothetical protein
MMSPKKIRPFMTVLCAAFLVLGVVSISSALPVTITASTSWVTSGTQTSTSQILSAIAAIIGPVPEAYKGENSGAEAGTFAPSYQTAFGAGDETATVTWVVATPFIGPPAWLLAKDGNGTATAPAWRLYNLTALGWTGTELITLGELWPDQGSFSHVSIFSSSTGIAVPEPATMLLLGLGLVGIGIAVRKRS